LLPSLFYPLLRQTTPVYILPNIFSEKQAGLVWNQSVIETI
jgi:hypothetical protein